MISSGSWRERRVLVTGATGLVGSWLVKDLIERGAHVVAFVRDLDPNSEFVRSGASQRVSIANGELEDYRAIERAINENEVNVVFHLGAQAIVSAAMRSPLATMESNILCIAESLMNKLVIGEAFNISPAKAYSAIEVVAAVQTALSCLDLMPIIEDRAKGEIHSQYLDGEKTQRLLGWNASFSLEQGLIETISWYKDFFHRETAYSEQANREDVCHA